MKEKKLENSKDSDVSEKINLDIDEQIEQTNSETVKESEKNEKTISKSSRSSKKDAIEEIKDLYDQLEKKDTEYNNIYSRYLRALADYENLQKRTKTERSEIIKKANEQIIMKLLDLADTFEKAEVNILSEKSNKIETIKDGFNVVRKQFNSILKNEGVERVHAVGKKFDPNFHEAIFVKSTTDKEEDLILEEVQAGYILNSALIRPSKVVIAKNKPKGEK